jgi:flagellar basal-body rod protein FlgB
MPMLDSPTTALVRLALDAASMRHLTLANNIANAESPGYAPQRVNFEAQLTQVRQALAAQRPLQASDLAGVRPEVEQAAVRGAASAAQSLDLGMVQVAQNTLHYQALLRALSRFGSIMAMAVDEGRR